MFRNISAACFEFSVETMSAPRAKFSSQRVRFEAEPSKIPVYISHGSKDGMVEVAWGRATAERLKARGFDVNFVEHEGLDHEVGGEQASSSRSSCVLLVRQRGATDCFLTVGLGPLTVTRRSGGRVEQGERSMSDIISISRTHSTWYIKYHAFAATAGRRTLGLDL